MQDSINPPLISIITACFNAKKSLQLCLTSVANQSFRQYEHIIIDGGSTDGSCSVLENFNYPNLFWSSQPDEGIADAMNKGIQNASGKWLLFLHADDFLISLDILQKIVDTLDPNAGINAYGITISGEARPRTWLPSNNRFRYLFKTPFPHQGAVIERSLFKTIGLYDRSFQISMDYDWFVRATDRGTATSQKSFPIATMNTGGISSFQDWPSLSKRFAEERKIHYGNTKSLSLKILYTVYWALYLPYRKTLATLKEFKT